MKLEYNQSEVEDKEYLYFPDGRKKAVLVHILKKGDCPACYEKDGMNFTDGTKVYRRIMDIN